VQFALYPDFDISLQRFLYSADVTHILTSIVVSRN